MWYERGWSSRSGPRTRSNQVSRRRRYACSAAADACASVDGELAQRDPLLLLVPRDRVGLAGQLRGQLLAGAEQLEPLVVEGGVQVGLELAELLALGVGVQDRQPRLGRPQRQLLALVRQPRGELGVLEGVLALDELGGDDPALADLAQAVELLALVALRRALGVPERIELLAGEQVGVAGDDLRLLGRLLLADADGAALLRALEQILTQPLLVGERRGDPCRRHAGESTRGARPRAGRRRCGRLRARTASGARRPRWRGARG